MKPRFLLDEHLGRVIQRQLHRRTREIEVLLIGDAGAPAKGIQDPDLLSWLESNDYILITSDASTIPDHLTEHYRQGRHIPGLFWVRSDASVGAIVEELFLIWEVSTAAEYIDRLLYIPL